MGNIRDSFCLCVLPLDRGIGLKDRTKFGDQPMHVEQKKPKLSTRPAALSSLLICDG